jgi:hypothetical protein
MGPLGQFALGVSSILLLVLYAITDEGLRCNAVRDGLCTIGEEVGLGGSALALRLQKPLHDCGDGHSA